MKDSVAQSRELYDRYRFGTFGYGRRRDAYEPLLFEALGRATPETVLYDIGCGTGYWIDAYLQAGVRKERIRCVDLAPANIADLQARGLDASVGDVLDLDVPDRSSDLTVSLGVIHHTDDPFRAFTELVRITRPGGLIYLNVYNRFHPYYYLVHRATFPLRYAYWHWSPRVADAAYWAARFFFQPLAYVTMGRFLDDQTGRTMFMDQVMTPRAHLFTRRRLSRYARACGCTVQAYRYNRYGLMLSALMQVR
ncbi:MAG TPA: class I SAM-dependent methyltransferase [Vicinamibacterales bacterium]|nr:class I SAM-dependent methyltransferase [Vicinamibacterales bacterium]